MNEVTGASRFASLSGAAAGVIASRLAPQHNIPADSPERSELVRMIASVEEMLASLDRSNNRLADFIGRVFGEGETQPGAPKGSPIPAGHLGTLDHMLSTIRESAARYEQLVLRVERLG